MILPATGDSTAMLSYHRHIAVVLLVMILSSWTLSSSDAFTTTSFSKRTMSFCPLMAVKHSSTSLLASSSTSSRRRDVLKHSSCAAVLLFPNMAAFAADNVDLLPLLKQVKQAKSQLDPVPDLIEKEQWDSVRAILITPPLSDCWAKTGKPLLQNYIDAIGETGGDELAALEAREDVSTHLRFLDMAVYNNVFNPIKTEGQTGATKQLIRSYYEDPIMEYKASVNALNDLIQAGQ